MDRNVGGETLRDIVGRDMGEETVREDENEDDDLETVDEVVNERMNCDEFEDDSEYIPSKDKISDHELCSDA